MNELTPPSIKNSASLQMQSSNGVWTTVHGALGNWDDIALRINTRAFTGALWGKQVKIGCCKLGNMRDRWIGRSDSSWKRILHLNKKIKIFYSNLKMS